MAVRGELLSWCEGDVLGSGTTSQVIVIDSPGYEPVNVLNSNGSANFNIRHEDIEVQGGVKWPLLSALFTLSPS